MDPHENSVVNLGIYLHNGVKLLPSSYLSDPRVTVVWDSKTVSGYLEWAKIERDEVSRNCIETMKIDRYP